MIELTKFTRFSGCGAKLGPCVLDKALCGLSQPQYPNMLMDYHHAEDAGIYKISDDVALVQSVDFFPPIVDDPFEFGQIAAANSLSDIYAMGAKPLSALGIVCFPKNEIDINVLRKIMEGALDKLKEAECALLGGHSVEDDEIKFGLAVTGQIHPQKILNNNSPQLNCDLVLTKPIGTGIINTALRGGIASQKAVLSAIKNMKELNKKAAQIAVDFEVKACTDITGFGLLGHLAEMISNTTIGAEINFKNIDLLPEVEAYAKMAMIPAGTYRNKEYRHNMLVANKSLPHEVIDILFDPQTSGGLLLAVSNKNSQHMVDKMKKHNIAARIIGKTTSNAEKIEIVL
ncbi:MAG: selenide, water dikinase SelD [Candidatus Cloacimonadota bacterium]|nr:selenide, water dikinase SelD [Candidatus Cloacimonadota bacterium]